MDKMLPAVWMMSSDFFIFQQDSALAHRAKDTIALLRRETPSFTVMADAVGAIPGRRVGLHH